MPLNRIVESSRVPSSKVELWHSNDEGDLRELEFRLPRGTSHSSVEAAFREYGKKWIDHLTSMGLKINPKTIQMEGPFPCLDFDELDMDAYIIQARWKQTKPEFVSISRADELFNNQPDDTYTLADMYRNAASAGPKAIEEQARMTVAAQNEMRRRRGNTD